MNLLIDTHTLLWFYWADPQLSPAAIQLITDPANRILVSPASHWEIAIKMKTGKLILREPFLDFFQHAILETPATSHHSMSQNLGIVSMG